MGRDLWMSSYQTTTSCLYHQPNHPRFRKKEAQESTGWPVNTNSKSKRYRRTKPWCFSSALSPLLKISSSVRSSPTVTIIVDLFVYILVVVTCIVCYANSLEGEFVHDDMVSITTNPDVIGKNKVKEIFLNDFWGKPMSDETSHKSYRPLTVLTFR